MPKIMCDVRAVIEFPFNGDEPLRPTIRTDIKRDALSEVLEHYIMEIMGQGTEAEGAAERIDRDVYHVTVGYNIAEDAFGFEHDCGNKGLAVGIVMDCVSRLNHTPIDIDVVSLHDTEKE